MTKEEFINFLNNKENERGVMSCGWVKTMVNSEDYWHLLVPAVDGLQPDMDLSVENVVRINYDKSLLDNESTKIFETTYEDFVKNYDKTIQR